MSDPAFHLLANSPDKRARLVTLRSAVRPLLASNYLSHFTDHSVDHSDRLCDIIDALAAPLGSTWRLSNREAAVLYAACYYHDAGMQHERAGDTRTIAQLLAGDARYKGRTWDLLELPTRQNLVRQYHHRISAELVRDAVRAGMSPLGASFTDDDDPGVIAALCQCHCLWLPEDKSEYDSLTAPQGGLRVGLLAALLRLADILDESRRRSQLNLQPVREMSPESRLHWWRHYYVSDISVGERLITVWFDFPKDKRPLYHELVRPLQWPHLESEFRHHFGVLSENGLSWNLEFRDTPELQTVARAMDADVERHAVELAAGRRADQSRQELVAAIDGLRAARAGISRQFAELRESTDSPDEQLNRGLELAEHLSKLGGKREAWSELNRHFQSLQAGSSEPIRHRIALRLAELMIANDASDQAKYVLQPFLQSLNKLPAGDDLKVRFLFLWGSILREQCAYPEAVDAFKQIAEGTSDHKLRSRAQAELAEMHLLQGELGSIDHEGTDNAH